MALMKFCRKSGCQVLTETKYCSEHIGQDLAKERERGSAAQRGYDRAWRKARLFFLRKHPLCVQCDKEGSIGAATVVDHIKPHNGDKIMFWVRENWQPLCKKHHDIKTATLDNGFGMKKEEMI